MFRNALLCLAFCSLYGCLGTTEDAGGISTDVVDDGSGGASDAGDDVIDVTDAEDPCNLIDPAIFTCPDGTIVYPCTCEDGEVSCIDDPASLCPAEPDAGTDAEPTDVVASDALDDADTSDDVEVDAPDITADVAPDVPLDCNDGSAPVCDRIPPTCGRGQILAVIDGCETCVDPATCLPVEPPSPCESDSMCANEYYCDDCAMPSCPVCLDCVAGCLPTPCPGDSDLACRMLRPDCPGGQVSTIRDGCWECVDAETCEPPVVAPASCVERGGYCVDGSEGTCRDGYAKVEGDMTCGDFAPAFCCEPDGSRDTHCDDGTDTLCLRAMVLCAPHEILAYRDSCFECVNPLTCEPWGTAGCRDADSCPRGQTCDSCATSSCPACDDCVAACVTPAVTCATEDVLYCRCPAPVCGADQVLVVRDHCWACANATTCETVYSGCGG